MRSRKAQDNAADLRQSPRMDAGNLICFACLDPEGSVLSQSMGKAVDISQTGLLLESALSVESDLVSLVSTDRSNRLLEIKGRVVYSRRSRSGNYLTGIQYIGTANEMTRFAGGLAINSGSRRESSEPITP